MSGHRIKHEPVYKAKAWRWGPPGWYCCGTRLMAAATLPAGAQIRYCRNCGLTAVVNGGELVSAQRPGHHTSAPSGPIRQTTVEELRTSQAG
jgi:hypothetical protein